MGWLFVAEFQHNTESDDVVSVNAGNLEPENAVDSALAMQTCALTSCAVEVQECDARDQFVVECHGFVNVCSSEVCSKLFACIVCISWLHSCGI